MPNIKRQNLKHWQR